MSKNNFQQNYAETILLGENSYNAVVNKINQRLMHAKAETIAGSEFLNSMYKTLNESNTPIMSLKPFITQGEELAQNDKTVGEVINIIKKSIKGNADLNFIINLCKEEHFDKMNRAGIPGAEETIKSIKDAFNKTSNDTIKLMQQGVFDCLQSTLLGEIKKKLGFSENEATKDDKDIVKLNESQVNLQYSNSGDIVRYSPIGFIVKDTKGQNYGFMEGCFVKMNESEEIRQMELVPGEVIDNLKQRHYKLMRAVEECVYNPETNEFSTKEAWDMNPTIDEDGKVFITTHNGDRREVDPDDVQKLFMESINAYAGDPTLNPHFSNKTRSAYIQDADNFCMLMQNYQKLVRFNNITTVRRLNESRDFVVMFENEQTRPTILINGMKQNTQYDSFMELCEDCNRTIGANGLFEPLFMKNLSEEENLLITKRNRLNELNENQKRLNRDIESVQSMKMAAEPNSPAMQKLNEREERLNNLLDKNIEEIKSLEESTLY